MPDREIVQLSVVTWAERELVVSRLIDAPRARVFAAWTDPQQLVRWWGPHGMTTPVCELEPRSGGLFRTVMRAPDGTEYPSRGIFLEVVAPKRIVFTDAFEAGWKPSGKAFMTAIVTFDERDGKTLHTARALHWSAADRLVHERMGFHQGWGESLDRLVAWVTLPRATPALFSASSPTPP